MDLQKIAPLIEIILKHELEKPQYPFGHPQRGKGNKIASGKLIDSIEVKFKKSKGEEILEVLMADYGAYVNDGRAPGKKPPPRAVIDKWLVQRGIAPRSNGKFATRKGLAIAIQKSIMKYGIRPTNFIGRAINEIKESVAIQNILEDATYEELINAIEGL